MPERVNGTDTICFINTTDVPQEKHKDVTYECILCDYRKGNAEPNRTRLTVGGYRINYLDNIWTPTADLFIV